MDEKSNNVSDYTVPNIYTSSHKIKYDDRISFHLTDTDSILPSNEAINKLIVTFTAPAITGEDVKLSAMHDFMKKHNWVLLDDKKKEEVLCRVPENDRSAFMAVYGVLLDIYTIKVCDSCGRIHIEK